MRFSELDRCSITGEPHYTTFSQCSLDYKGICRHLLAAPKSSYNGQNNFTIYVKHQRQNTYSASVLYVETIFKSDVVRLKRDSSSSCQTIVPVIVTVKK